MLCGCGSLPVMPTAAVQVNPPRHPLNISPGHFTQRERLMRLLPLPLPLLLLLLALCGLPRAPSAAASPGGYGAYKRGRSTLQAQVGTAASFCPTHRWLRRAAKASTCKPSPMLSPNHSCSPMLKTDACGKVCRPEAGAACMRACSALCM